jgi:hypothetical protein
MERVGSIFRRTIKVGDDELFENAYSDYIHARHHLREPQEAKGLTFASDVLLKSRKFWERLTPKRKMFVELGVILPTALAGISAGHFIPDLDIRVLGLGWHRYFLSHSALGAHLLKRFWESYNDFLSRNPDDKTDKLVGTFLAAGAFSLGIHLLADGSFGIFDGEKAVVWGIPGIGKLGTLVEGTMIDDNLYLLGNSLWAFKIAKDIMVVTYAKELELTKKFFSRYFPRESIYLLAKRWGEESMGQGEIQLAGSS